MYFAASMERNEAPASQRGISGNVSIRMLWAFARVLADFRPELEFLHEHGVTDAMLADPDARIPQQLLKEVLVQSAQRISDPALGLHAGERTEAADWGVIHYMSRNCSTVRGGMQHLAQYIRLVDDLADAAIVEDGNRAAWQIVYSIPRTPMAHDFQAAATLRTLERMAGAPVRPLEVHFTHARPTNAAEYERVFRAPIKLGAPINAIVFERSVLDLPLMDSNPDLLEPFEQQARRMLESIARVETTGAKVQRLILERLGGGEVSMLTVSRRLHMSPATLRRRLAEEGTTYQALLDEVRRELALRHIQNPRLAITEIAGLLGFSTVSAFGKAFRRWCGTTAIDYRSELRERAAAERRASG